MVQSDTKREADRASRQFDQDQVTGHILYVEDNSDDSREIPPVTNPKVWTNISSQNRTRLLTLTAACDQFFISNYAEAAIATTALTDYGIITKVDKSQVIGPHKLCDVRQKY